MIDMLLDILIRPREDKLTLLPCEMVTVMNYAKRLERIAPEEVDSACGPARPMLLVAESNGAPLEFLGVGKNVLQVYPPRRD